MGTYTTNYQMYMPTVGEQGWGTLVNENFTTIDSTMKSLSNRITAVENDVNGNLSCTSVTTSGKITGNGGIAGTTGTFSGAVTGATFNGVAIKKSVTVTPDTSITIKYGQTSFPLLTYDPYGVKYSGSLSFKNSNSSNSVTVKIYTGTAVISESIAAGKTTSISFANADILYVIVGNATTIYGFTLS